MKRIFVLFGVIVLFSAAFSAETVSAQKKTGKRAWSGEWKVPSRFYGSTLTIKSLSAGRFRFHLAAINGANMGDISGVATVKGAKAYFDDRRQGKKSEDVYGCKLAFTHKGAFIDIEQNNECGSYAGLGVFFSAEYYKGKQKVRESDFVALEVFPNAAIDRKFKVLVGNDYERFLDSFHQIGEDEDLDAFGAKVFSACVRGICPWTAGIIMYDAKGNIWAAVMNDEDSDNILVNYYTNAPDWSDKLPKTIDKWIAEKRETTENLKVVYKKVKSKK